MLTVAKRANELDDLPKETHSLNFCLRHNSELINTEKQIHLLLSEPLYSKQFSNINFMSPENYKSKRNTSFILNKNKFLSIQPDS